MTLNISSPLATPATFGGQAAHNVSALGGQSLGQGGVAPGDFRTQLIATARRSVGLTKACNNDESIRLYLVLPFIGLLGFNAGDPLEVYPNHETDAIDGVVHRADFAILANGNPTIAFAVGRTPEGRIERQSSLARYFTAWRSTKLAIVTNGIVFDFFVDSATPGLMDAEPFLSVDLQTIAQGGVTDEIVETLALATKTHFAPDTIAERAHLQLVKKRLRSAFLNETSAPSERLVRAMMETIGFPGASAAAIERHYAPLAKAALEEAIIVPVVQKLRATGGGGADFAAAAQSVAGAEREVAVFNAVRRRLAYLAADEAQYHALDRLDYRDSVGKITIFLDHDPRGRIVEVLPGIDGTHKFIFPDGLGEIVAADLAGVDGALRAAFVTRVSEMTRAVGIVGLAQVA